MPYLTEGPPAPPRFIKSDPIHHLFLSVQSRSDLDLDLKDHLLLCLQPFLGRVEGEKDFELRAMLEAGLYCYVQRKIIQRSLDKEKAGSPKHRELAGQYRAWVECFAKAYRLKGMKAPSKPRQPRSTSKSKIPPASLPPEERELAQV